jgi:fructokinase
MNHGPLKIERGVGSPLIAGIELGGTKCICTLGSGPDEVVSEARIATTTPQETLGAIEAIIDGWVRDHDVAAIGIASFGPLELDPRSDQFGYITATTKPGWPGTSVAQRFAHRYALPIAFDTDVVGAALGEARWGAASELSTFAYVTVGTGIGAGLIVNGQPLRGRGHPELGHIHVARRPGDTWAGACPYHGDCVEGLAAGYAIAKRTGRVATDVPGDDSCWHDVAHAIAGCVITWF